MEETRRFFFSWAPFSFLKNVLLAHNNNNVAEDTRAEREKFFNNNLLYYRNPGISIALRDTTKNRLALQCFLTRRTSKANILSVSALEAIPLNFKGK